MSTIVVIDDCESVLNFMKVKISHRHKLYTYKKPLVALVEVPNINPDLVICDYMMYDMIGLDVIEHLRDSNVQTKYILFTSLKDPELGTFCEQKDITLINKQTGLQGLLEDIECLP